MEEKEKEEIGRMAGLGAGMLGGARIGSVIPIPLVGTFAGAVIGGVLGSEVGKKFGKAVINGATEFVGTIKTELTGKDESTGESAAAKEATAD